jgi:hypothetical protein
MVSAPKPYNRQGTGAMSIHQKILQEKATLVLILFVGLLLLDPLIPGALTSLSFAAIGVAGAWLLSAPKSFSRKAIVVSSSVAAIAIILGKFLPEHMLEAARMPIGILLLIFTIILYTWCGSLMLSAVLKAKEVTHQLIISAVNFYIILGMFYAHIYTILDWFRPESFALQVLDRESASHFVYFSFVTLATLGYGDITPKTEFAQRLAVSEAIMGQFFGWLVVAYLVSVYVGRRMQASDSDLNRKRDSDISA